MQYDDLIVYDWFSFTSTHRDPFSIIDLLGMDGIEFQAAPGARGYKNRLYFEGISIHYDSEREDTWLEMSGQGCRCYETYGSGDWHRLFEEVVSDPEYHITRLDVAFDDHSGILDIEKLFLDTHLQYFVAKFEFWENVESSKGITIYHGSPQSDVRFRIYDKAKEKNQDGHWIRFEIQLRNDNAYRFINKLILQTVGEVFCGVINNYLRYVTPSAGGSDRRRRWPTAPYWQDFISTAQKISLYEAPGEEYNLEKLERYALDQAGPAVATSIELWGEEYIDKCYQKLAASSKPKYADLLRKHKTETSRKW